ncbi:MAG: hypothetical protein JKY92_03320 [Magnetovibrio sp.]|nr:hypothetical protein [Magnetovibrio sp.]
MNSAEYIQVVIAVILALTFLGVMLQLRALTKQVIIQNGQAVIQIE